MLSLVHNSVAWMCYIFVPVNNVTVFWRVTSFSQWDTTHCFRCRPGALRAFGALRHRCFIPWLHWGCPGYLKAHRYLLFFLYFLVVRQKMISSLRCRWQIRHIQIRVIWEGKRGDDGDLWSCCGGRPGLLEEEGEGETVAERRMVMTAALTSGAVINHGLLY